MCCLFEPCFVGLFFLCLYIYCVFFCSQFGASFGHKTSKYEFALLDQLRSEADYFRVQFGFTKKNWIISCTIFNQL